MGAASSDQAIQGLAFYPSSTLTIDSGDTVEWSYPAGEPHTVSLLAPGQKLPSASDPSDQKPAGGSTYDGTRFTSSGFLLLGKTYSLKFTKPGTYKVYCLIHQPEMVQTIVVNEPGTAYPQQQTAYDASAATASAADLASGLAAAKAFPYAVGGLHFVAGTAPGGPTAPSSTASVLRFLSAGDPGATTATVPVGSTVTWTNASNNEPHNVVFAPVGQPFPTLDPFAPASGGNVYDGTQLVDSGVLLPGQSVSYTFPKAGTYQYHCTFHDDTENMIGTLIVK